MLWRLALLAAGLFAVTAAATEICDVPSHFPARGRLTSKDVILVFRTVPESIEVGRSFSVEVFVCATPPAQGLRVDAQMPDHRHGMNYRPTIEATGDGRYLAEGLVFHMPGRWQLLFDVQRGGRTEQLATDILLE
jgi:hypothetical protein